MRFTYVSPGFAERSSRDAAVILGKRRWDFDNVLPVSGTWEDHRRVLEAHEPFRDFEQITVRADGTRLFISSSGQPVFDDDGNFKGYRGVGSNITVRKNAEEKLAQLAQFDAVTGLANRYLLQERLEHAIAQARRRGRGAAVLFVDLDRFKLVNDTHGHQVGDQLLAQVGRSLKVCVRQDDTVARLGGDEFAIVIADLARPDDAAIVAQKILDSFAAPFELGGQEAFITASIGVATFPNDGDGADTLLKCADVAMYRAKESSRNAFCFYTAEMNARAASKLQLNTDLRRALERREFRLHYQPKVNLATGEMIGMEALLRWQHAERGLVPPLEFIPALEDSGLIVAVGDWVVEEACRQLREWSRAGLALAPVAVNLSARQFRRRDLDQVIRRHAGRARPVSGAARAGDHREQPDGGPQGRHPPAAGAARGGPENLGGRLRHGVLEPRLPDPPAAVHAEDRPHLRQRGDHRVELGGDREDGDRHGAAAQLRRRRRGHRDRPSTWLSCASTAAARGRATTSAGRFPPRPWRRACASA